ncbi:MAG: hypothetical protein V1809_11915 [Planctomycetota bacterium]
MTSRSTLVIVLAVAGIAGTAALAVRNHALSGRIADLEARAKKLAAAEKTSAQAQEASHRAVQRVRDLTTARDAAEARATAAETRLAAPATPSPAPSPIPLPSENPAPKAKRGGMKKMLMMMKTATDNPAMKSQVRQGFRMMMDPLYKELLAGWGLDEKTRGEVMDAIADRAVSLQMDIGMLILDDTVPEAEILRKQQDALTASDTALSALVGTGRLAEIDTFEKTLPEKMMRRQIDQEVSALALDPGRKETLAGILLEEQKAAAADLGGMHHGPEDGFRRFTAEDIRKSREMFDGEGFSAVVTKMRESHQKVMDRAKPILSPEEFQTFEKQEAAKIQMIEMSMKMMEAMGGGEPEAK